MIIEKELEGWPAGMHGCTECIMHRGGAFISAQYQRWLSAISYKLTLWMSKLRNQLKTLALPSWHLKWWSPSSWELHVIMIKFNVYASCVYPKAYFLSYPGLPWGAFYIDPTLLLPKRTQTVFERLTLQLTSIVKKVRCGSEEPRSQFSLPGN